MPFSQFLQVSFTTPPQFIYYRRGLLCQHADWVRTEEGSTRAELIQLLCHFSVHRLLTLFRVYYAMLWVALHRLSFVAPYSRVSRRSWTSIRKRLLDRTPSRNQRDLESLIDVPTEWMSGSRSNWSDKQSSSFANCSRFRVDLMPVSGYLLESGLCIGCRCSWWLLGGGKRGKIWTYIQTLGLEFSVNENSWTKEIRHTVQSEKENDRQKGLLPNASFPRVF